MATLMLFCAIMAAMAFGVLLAYGIFGAMFGLFRAYSGAAAAQPVDNKPVSAISH